MLILTLEAVRKTYAGRLLFLPATILSPLSVYTFVPFLYTNWIPSLPLLRHPSLHSDLPDTHRSFFTCLSIKHSASLRLPPPLPHAEYVLSLPHTSLFSLYKRSSRRTVSLALTFPSLTVPHLSVSGPGMSCSYFVLRGRKLWWSSFPALPSLPSHPTFWLFLSCGCILVSLIHSSCSSSKGTFLFLF